MQMCKKYELGDNYQCVHNSFTFEMYDHLYPNPDFFQ